MHSEILIPISLFFLIGFLAKNGMEHKTMRTLINHGENLGDMKEILNELSRRTHVMSSMKWGLVLVGIGLAFIIARFFPRGMQDEMTVAFMFILAGLGLIFYYYYWGKRNEQSDSPV